MMSCEELPEQIEIVRGDTSPFTVTITDADTGLPIDITGDTIELFVKDAPEDGTAYIIFKENTVHSDPENGETEFTFSSSESSLLNLGVRYWIGAARIVPGSPDEITTVLDTRLIVTRSLRNTEEASA